MTEKVGVLVVSYGAREAAIVDALCRSENYKVKIYDADKQRNPFILERCEAYEITGSNLDKICEFAKKNKENIDFAIVGYEEPIIKGVRNILEKETNIPVICPTKEYAVEGSKVYQRFLLEECAPNCNPKFKVFYPKDYSTVEEAKEELLKWLKELNTEVAVKPDTPAMGKGVGVWGDHFNTKEELWEHFLSIYKNCGVIVEEKIKGEEFSLQFFSDGKHLVATPAVRDYKRAFDNDLGANTGGMGSYKAEKEYMPWMEEKDWRDAIEIGTKIFKKLRGNGNNVGLRGVPLYVAFTCTSEGLKIFELNSRPGDPEIQNLLPILEDDFVEICFAVLEGKLSELKFAPKATVATYAVPMTYGGYRTKYSGDRVVDLSGAYKLTEKYKDNIRVYPGSLELCEDGKIRALGSRAVCVVGIGATIEEAREISLAGIKAIDGALWNRWDIASKAHIERSREHLKKLRMNL
ncbi:MAG: hypothetical protein QME47_01780 [Candidatus Thermoplasmatota archaeon]|nr:hypothetical protein [Candidatus Thermoplasmatota archaeon]